MFLNLRDRVQYMFIISQSLHYQYLHVLTLLDKLCEKFPSSAEFDIFLVIL